MRLASHIALSGVLITACCASQVARANPPTREESALSHFRRGHELASVGRHEEALAAYRKVAELSEDFPAMDILYGNIGFALLQLERLDEALVAFEEALRWAEKDELREQIEVYIADIKTRLFGQLTVVCGSIHGAMIRIDDGEWLPCPTFFHEVKKGLRRIEGTVSRTPASALTADVIVTTEVRPNTADVVQLPLVPKPPPERREPQTTETASLPTATSQLGPAVVVGAGSLIAVAGLGVWLAGEDSVGLWGGGRTSTVETISLAAIGTGTAMAAGGLVWSVLTKETSVSAMSITAVERTLLFGWAGLW